MLNKVKPVEFIGKVRAEVGYIVPIPTFPFCNTVNPEVPATLKPPANVEVAVVEVAVIYATVGDVEAARAPVPPSEYNQP